MSVDWDPSPHVEDLCSSIENLNVEPRHGQIVISDRDTPSLPESPAELLLMYDVRRDASPSRMTTSSYGPPQYVDVRSPTRLQGEPLSLDGGSSSAAPLSNAARGSHQSQSLPNSPFFNQNEIEEHGIKAREITQKLIRSLNETKGRLERHNNVGRDLSPCVDNILRQSSVTVSHVREPYNRRLFNDDGGLPSGILRSASSPKKLGPVLFETTEPQRDYGTADFTTTTNYTTDNSFNTLAPDSSFNRSGFVNSENECLGIFEDRVRMPGREVDGREGEFIPGLRELDEMTRRGMEQHQHHHQHQHHKQHQQQTMPLSPGAKKAMDTLSDRATVDLMRREEYSNVTSDEIREMEGVRNHLHTLIQTNQSPRDFSTNRRTDSVSPTRSPTRSPMRSPMRSPTRSPTRSPSRSRPTTTNQDSFHNYSTSASTNQGPSWSSLPSANQKASITSWSNHSPRRGRSPERRWRGGTNWAALAQKESGRTNYSDLDFDEIMQLASRASTRSPREHSTIADPLERSTEPMQMEVRVLKENCEREKFRRQHCEQIIETLQRRLAENQEQLSMSVSTERKKDVMIDQLDKTLSRVVDGWKQREAEKQGFIEKLKLEGEALTIKLESKTEMMSKFESSLQEALAELAVEQKKVADLETFKEEEHEKEHERLTEMMEQQQKKVTEAEREKEILKAELAELKRTHDELQDVLLEERSGWQETTEDLKLKINNLDADFRDCLTSEKERADEAEGSLDGTKHVLASVQKELQRCQTDLDLITRERNTLRVEMGLLEARMESSKRKLESDLTAEFEKTLSKKLTEADDNHVQTEKDLRDTHHKMMHELSEKNQKTLDEAIRTLKENFGKREVAYKEEIQTLEERLEQSTKDIQELRLAKQRIEAQRDRLNPEEQWHDIKKEDLVKNLKSLMESHAEHGTDSLNRAEQERMVEYDDPDLHPRHQSRPPYQPRPQSPPRTHHGTYFGSHDHYHAPDWRTTGELRQHAFDHTADPSTRQLSAIMTMSPPGIPPIVHQSSSYRGGGAVRPTNERQRNIEDAFNVVQSAPPSYPPSTGRYGRDSDLGKKRVHPPPTIRPAPRISQKNNNNDGVSDVLSNDGLQDCYYPISEPGTRYATPTRHLSSNQYVAPAPARHVMETPRVAAVQYEPSFLRTPIVIAPPVATSTELREHRKYPDPQSQQRTGSLLSSGYYSTVTPSNRFSVGSTAEFVPLQPCHDESSYDQVGYDHHDGLSQHRLSPSRLTNGSRDLNQSTHSLREVQRDHQNGSSGPPPLLIDDSFRSLPCNGGSTYNDLSERVVSHDNRQAELQSLVKKLLHQSDSESADNSKENLPPLPHSPPQKLERVQQNARIEKDAPPTGVLTPGQVGEIQRLLDAYQQNNGVTADTINPNKIEGLLMYLKDAQQKQSNNEPSSTFEGEVPTNNNDTSDSRLVSVSHAPKYASSTNAARQKLYERSNRIVAGEQNKSGSNNSGNAKSRPASKPDRKVAPKSGSRTPPVWR